ncbi:hypothetical protein HH310_39620 [Actinoplanes sp. TBRC 11911]|uniref:histidine kinase dimerization/phospho-acceptor domain-containing protein n=1 Tax=Actinoplanes sp. TBRC 11911 TaxID=2729386 RepID=UPI00145C9447|nr:histidine kinase dimerization/phospho-acceptor domain-containing protein [Actinoplanes sp. TBRC 11911]NMO57271.1 hypothetical protein [Actinoplanes sp. TBRC 11911]
MDSMLKSCVVRLDDEAVITLNHEVRTPLASIVGNLDILMGAPDAVDPQYDRALFAIARGVERLTDVVDELLRQASR